MSEPIDILEVAANRLADARMLVHRYLGCQFSRDSLVNLDIARIQLKLAQQDMEAVSHVMDDLR